MIFRLIVMWLMLAMSFEQAAYASKRFPMTLKIPVVGTKKKMAAKDFAKDKKVMIVQFWASWCVGCGEVMADLAARSKKDSAVGFVTISLDEDMPTAVRYFKAKPDVVKQALPNALLDKAGEQIAEPLGIKSLPALIVMNSEGNISQTMNGHPKAGELDAAIQKVKGR